MNASHPDEPELDQELENILGAFYSRYNVLKAENAKVKAVLKLGRNERCPCGSGKKVKTCHGGIKGGEVQANFRRADFLISRPPEYWVKDTSFNGLLPLAFMAALGGD